MSAQQFFSEVEAVVGILSEWVDGVEDLPEVQGYSTPDVQVETFTAIWQAIELLARSHTVLMAMAQFEMSKQALDVPDVRQSAQAPKLYDGHGKPLA